MLTDSGQGATALAAVPRLGWSSSGSTTLPNMTFHSPFTFRRSTALLIGVIVLVAPACQVGKVGSRCRPGGDWGRDNTHVLRCEGGRWKRTITIEQYLNLLAQPPSAGAPDPAPSSPAPVETVSQRNARQKAADYLNYSAFSRQGLIDQLEYEKFSEADATYGTDAVGANWNEQAAKKAADYLRYSSFSRQGLIDQLLYEKFTQEQAEYGVSTTGL